MGKIGNMISVIIPHYPMSEELDVLLKNCVQSLVGADEIIVVVNEGTGFAKNVNRGLRIASGDYMCVANNDLTLIRGNIQDLADPMGVTSPMQNNQDHQVFWGSFFCIPRWVYEKIGGLDERFEMAYYEDDDYIRRLVEARIPMRCVKSVEIHHLGGRTLRNMNHEKYTEENKIKFQEKWDKSRI